MNGVQFNLGGDSITFYTDTRFKTYVRQAIEEQSYWNNLVSKINISHQIDEKLKYDLPDKVNSEMERKLPNMLDNKMNYYYLTILPTQVANQLDTQITKYVNNNFQFQNILEKHKSDLNQQLEIGAKKILTEVVDDPNYHKITTEHLNAIDKKGEQKITQISKTAENKFTSIDEKFNDNIKNMKHDVENTLSSLKQSLNSVARLEKEVQTLKNDVASLKGTTIGMFLCSALIIGYLMVKNLN